MKYILRFWGRVLLRYKDTVIRILQVRDQIVEGSLRLIGLIVASILGWSGVMSLDLVQQLSGDWQAFVRYASLLLVGAAVILVFNLILQPVKMYDELGGFLDNPLSITPEPKRLRSDIPTWASVKVSNLSRFRVEECTLTLKDVEDMADGKHVLRTSERLTWSGRDQMQPDQPGTEGKTIIGKGWRICDIAHTQAKLNRAIFTLWFNNNQTVPPGHYRIEVEVNGEWIREDRPIGFSGRVFFDLAYDGGLDLEIIRAIDNSI